MMLSWSSEAARLMNERQCLGLGTDTISIDAGYKCDLIKGFTVETAFDAHLEILRQDKWLLENVKIVEGLPSEGATLVVAPIPIQGGSEAVCRLLAYV
jgi:kynurenine formamidase